MKKTLLNDDIGSYHVVRNDIEDCLTKGASVTPTEAKNLTRRLMEMFEAKGYGITIEQKDAQ